MPFANPAPRPPPGTPGAAPQTAPQGSRPGRSAGAWTLGLALLWASGCLAQGWLETGELELQQAKVPVYLDSEPRPAAIFRAERVYTDHQTRGFFKIGLLRLLVLEKLSLELLEPERLSATLRHAGGQFPLQAGMKQAVEGRDFSLFFAAEKSGQLNARRVRLENRAMWCLEQGTITSPARLPIAFKRGILTLTGPHAGELACETTNGLLRLPLLSLLPRKEP